MSRNTVTLTAPNGAKVRTVRSRKYFVVSFGDLHVRYVKGVNGEPGTHVRLDPPVANATVMQRTDSSLAAWRGLNRHGGNLVVFEVVAHNGEIEVKQLPHDVVDRRAQREKREMKLAKQHGYKHVAF